MTQRSDPADEQRGNRAQGWLLAAVLAAFVALAVWYSVTIPLGEAPDEVPHFTYIRYIAQHRALPSAHDEHEAFQPPLYYALAAGLTFWIQDAPDAPFAIRANADYDPVDARAPKNLLLHTADEASPYRGWALAWHVVRLFSIALGALTVWAVYRLGRVLFPAQAAIPLAMAGLTAFTPQFLFMSAVVNNDNAAVAISALILWRVAALLHEPECHRFTRDSLVIGVLLGLGMLSKASASAGVVIAGLAILIAGLGCRSPEGVLRDRKRRVGLTVRGLLVAGVLAAAIAGWYFVRNWRLYGDALGWSFLL
jgi:Dolichyl-phosphate-mannose-protein mannosyltransferase